MTVFVKCKTEDCDLDVPAEEYAQVPEDQLEQALHKKNYYLCKSCGKVYAYTREDHFLRESA